MFRSLRGILSRLIYMQPGGLKNGNQNQGTRSEGLEGTKGGERYLRDLQT